MPVLAGVALLTTVLALAPATAHAQLPAPPATPRAACGPGSIPEPGLQGRVAKADVDSGAAASGYRCNITVVGRSGETGGFKVLRYVDASGRECAYYDTTLLFPTNTFNLSLAPTGVAVLDMSNPARPVRTTTLVTPAMQSPHESVNISVRRGLLAAVAGNPAFLPGQVDVYDISADCRNPVLKTTAPVGFLGHESGMAPDGRTFYATSIGTGQTTPVDISDPMVPRTLGVYQFNSHGMTVSDDGTRGYMASGDGLIVVDLTEVQRREPDPQVREISRLTWPEMTIPQVAHPVTIDGRPYLIEVDEYSRNEGSTVTGNGAIVGAARIIDIADERDPKVVSNIRLEVHSPENRAAIAGDYGARNPTQGYAGHYCGVPSRVDPGIVACSMILSGLRVFDIRDPRNPKEIAYFVPPPDTVSLTGGPVIDERANWAMSQPAFAPERGEIWYSDGTSGFYALKVDPSVWPFPPVTQVTGGGPSGGGSSAPVCGPRARVALPRFAGRRIVRAVGRVDGERVLVRGGRALRFVRFVRGETDVVVRIRLTTVDRSGVKAYRTIKRRISPC